MRAFILPDGRLVVPRRVYDPETGITGDAMVAVEADSPEGREWADWAEPAPPAVVEQFGQRNS